MKRILLIKLTSLGDLIHTLPALTDAYMAHPSIEFDWVADENFQEIATWHPAVKHVFTTNHRVWRHALNELQTYRTVINLVKSLRRQKYDLIIDGQGNFKTALLAYAMRGVTAGYDRHSVRERVAALAYQKRYSISKKKHAIERLRQLFASALDYQLPTTPPQFLINQEKFKVPPIPLPLDFLVFVHSASWKTKLWPEAHWMSLIKAALDKGHTIVLPWGSVEEKERAKRLAISERVLLPPKLSLSEMGYLLGHAKGCVCVDTGFSHLAAALNVPTLTLYGSTDSGLIGTSGRGQEHLQAKLACAPCNKRRCRFPSGTLSPPCLAMHDPKSVFFALENLLTRIL